MYNDMMAKVENNDFSLLNPMHLTLSCLKAFLTWETLESVKTCRELCGGHGFSSYAGFSKLIDATASHVTLEGDNWVMMQQTARGLIKAL